MTRSEFLDNVEYTLYNVMEYVDDFGIGDYSPFEDIGDGNVLDDWVNDDVSECDRNWDTLRDLLDDIPTGYEYYRRDGYFDYVGLDDSDANDLVDRILEIMDDNEWWDDEDEDDEVIEEEADEPSEKEPEIKLEFEIDPELFAKSCSEFVKLKVLE